MDGAISAAGPWQPALLEVGRARHPGAWLGPAELFPEWVWSPVNILLLRGPLTVLVDAGSGGFGGWWPFEGYEDDLPAALAAAGAAPGDVELLVLTHLDYDHAGGLLAGEWPDRLELAFPRVPVALLAEAAAAARTAVLDEEQNLGPRLVALLERSGLLRELPDGGEPAPGLRLRSAPGHRTGHAALEVLGDDLFVHLADTLHHEVHAEHPEWDTQADSDPALALVTRRRLLAEVAASGARCVVTHIPGPHALRVEHEGAAFRFRRA